MPVWKQKKRPLTRPRPIGRMSAASMPRASRSAARTGSLGSAQRAGEHVGRAAGQHAERGVGAGDAGRHLVERAVAAVADDDVDAAPGGVVGEPGGVPAPVGLDQLDVVPLRQSPVHDDGVACRHRRGERVDDEQDPQGVVTVSAARNIRPNAIDPPLAPASSFARHERDRVCEADSGPCLAG